MLSIPNRLRTRMVCEGALFLAAAHVLGYLKLFHLPQGGSLSLLGLPILLFSLRWGVRPGVTAGVGLGVLQFLLDGGVALGWQSMLGDYLIACAVLGLAGLFARRKLGGFCVGLFLGGLARYGVLVFTGAVLWGALMPEEFLGLPMTSPWVYALLYNLPALGSAVANLAAGMLLYRPLRRYCAGRDLLD